jgi:hypothetical protein
LYDDASAAAEEANRMAPDTSRRLLNHVEMVYRPGEKALAVALLDLLGFRVFDDGGEFVAASADPAAPDIIDNTCYISQMTPEQQAFEKELERALAGADGLGQAHSAYRDLLHREPQRGMHFGVHTTTLEDLEATVERVNKVEQNAPELAGRVRVSGTFYPKGPGSLADNIVQAFFYTDVIASGLVTVGQHFELHWYTDQPPALGTLESRLSYQTS